MISIKRRHNPFNSQAFKTFILLIFNFSFGMVFAQGVFDTHFSLQPLIYQKDGKITGCGIRFVGLEEIQGNNLSLRAIDGSVVLDRDGYALSKLGISTTNSSDVLRGNITSTSVKIHDYWLRSSNEKITKPTHEKIIESKEPIGYALKKISVEDFFDFYESTNTGKEIQIGAILKNSKHTWIYSGKINFTDKDQSRIDSCIRNLFK